MSDVFKQLEELEKNNNKKLYVFYDIQTGEIIHIRNYCSLDADSYPFVVIDPNNFDSSLNAVDYLVTNHGSEPILIKKETLFLKYFNNIDDVIHRIEKETVFDNDINIKYDLLIEQNFIKNHFRFKLNDYLKKIYNSQIFKDKIIELYATDINDPHILYKTIKLNMLELVKNTSIIISFDENTKQDINFYTSRYFPKYIHVVVKELQT
jgi:hypothetical protein